MEPSTFVLDYELCTVVIRALSAEEADERVRRERPDCGRLQASFKLGEIDAVFVGPKMRTIWETP